MASRFPPDYRVQLIPRKGHDMQWKCYMHAEPIAFYCTKHDIPICHRCATKDHGREPCELDDIEDVILERKRRLYDKQQEIGEMKKQLITLDSKIESVATSSSNHFILVNNECKVAFKGKFRSGKDKIKRADKPIQRIEEREKLIKTRIDETEQQERKAKVKSEIKAIEEVVAKKINDLTIKIQHAISTIDNFVVKIKRIKQEDKILVNEALQVLASLDDSLSLNVHQDVSNCLGRIPREVQKVKFVEGEVGGEHYGRIDGYIGKWELVKSIHISSIVNKHHVRGLISDDEVCVQAAQDNAMYVINISTEHTQNVIEGNWDMYITSCALRDSNVIVCGKGRRGFTDGCITLYDRQWEVIRDISIPKNSNCIDDVYVDVDRDGMILAARHDQSKIYVINPADGKIVNTITIQGKVVTGEVQALSSGDIVAETGNNQFTVISRSGKEKAAIHCDEWESSWCRVDKVTDTLYITYVDAERTRTGVDQVSCDGIIQAKKIVEYEGTEGYTDTSRCLVTPSGNIVFLDGNELFVYKKIFII